MTVQITRLQHDADGPSAHDMHSRGTCWRRLLALALVLERHGMDRQTLRDRVIRYKEHGIAGLSNLPKRGPAQAVYAPTRRLYAPVVSRGTN
jgi:hypothetical protein